MNLSSFDGSIFERVFQIVPLGTLQPDWLAGFCLEEQGIDAQGSGSHVEAHQSAGSPTSTIFPELPAFVDSEFSCTPYLRPCHLQQRIAEFEGLWISGRWQRVPLSQSCLAHLQGNCVAELPGFQEALGGWEDATLPQSASLRMLTMSVVQSLTHAKLYKVKQSAQLFMCGFSVQ